MFVDGYEQAFDDARFRHAYDVAALLRRFVTRAFDVTQMLIR